MSNRELTAEDYTYRLPDHWLLNAEDPSSSFSIIHNAYVKRVTEIVVKSKARTVLEVGCGDGWNCGKLADAGLEVVGVDWSRNGIGYATMLVPKGQFYCGDVRDREFINRFPTPFDAVVFVEVLEHIPPNDCIDAIKNIVAPLRSNGILVLTTPSVNLTNSNPQHYRHFDVPTLQALIAEAGGLTVESIEGYGDVPKEKKLYRLMRWFDNRYYCIKPVKKKLLLGFAKYCLDRPLDRCSGFITTIRKR